MTIAPSGRLYQALVESKKASAVDAWNLELSDPGNLIFWAQVPLGDSADAARAAMLETLYGLRDKPITQAEVDRVKTRTLTSIDEIINDPQQLGLVLSESIAVGDWRLFFIQRDRWRALTAADVQRVGARVPEERQPDLRAVLSPMPSPIARPRRRPSTSRRWSPITRATRRWRPARSSTPPRRTWKRARSGSRCPTG